MAFTTALAAVSCGGNTDKAMKDIPKIPQIIGATLEKEIISQDKQDTAKSILAYEFFATPQERWQDSVNHAIGSFMWYSMAIGEQPYKYEPLSHAFFQERLDTFERSYHQYEDGSEYPMIWTCEITSEIQDSLKGYAQVMQSCYISEGGAHPNSFSSYIVISKQDGKTLLLKDLVRNVPQFNRIAEKYFRIAREIGPKVSLAEEFWFENGTFACNDNFRITPQGIEFQFNPYEIAAYVYGGTTFTVPFSEIKPLLLIDLSK